jgi:hypothetical protein
MKCMIQLMILALWLALGSVYWGAARERRPLSQILVLAPTNTIYWALML